MTYSQNDLKNYKVEIILQKKDGAYSWWKRINYSTEEEFEYHENFENIIKKDEQDFQKVLRYLSVVFKSQNSQPQEYQNLEKEELIRVLEEYQRENINLKSTLVDLEKQNFELSDKCLNKKKDQLRDKVLRLEREISGQNQNINKLSRDLNDEHSYNRQLQQRLNQYQTAQTNYQNLVHNYKSLQQQVSRLPHLEAENEKLRESKKNLMKRLSSTQQELDKARQKLYLATDRLRDKIVQPDIIDGSDRSDQLKHDFDNLKRGLFHDTSGKILSCWRVQDNTLSFRSEEFSQIKSILSQHVFIEGMSYFAGEQSEVSANVELIINELISVEDLSKTHLQIIQQTIENKLLKTNKVDNSDEGLIKYVETTSTRILQDLNTIRVFPLSEDVVKEIKNFVREALKLVQDVVTNPSPAEFYLPEVDDEFDENLHDTRGETEGKIKLVICPAYGIRGTTPLTKADVVTYIPDTPNITETLDSSDDSLETITSNKVDTTDISEEPFNEVVTTNTSETSSNGQENENTKLNQNQPSREFIEDSDKNPLLDKDNQPNTSQQSSDSSSGKIQSESSKSYSDEQSDNIEKSDVAEGIYLSSFTGIVEPSHGTSLYNQPHEDKKYFIGLNAQRDQELEFDAWTYGDEMKFGRQHDLRWYRCKNEIYGQQCWVSAVHIKGEPPNSSPFPLKQEDKANEG